MKNTQRRVSRNVAALCAALIALAFYLITMNRTFGVVDYGELSACAYTLGIPHPTGYPSIMLLGYGWSHALGALGVRPVLALNILAAVLVAASVYMLTLLFDYIIGLMFPKDGSVSEQTGGSNSLVISSALIALFVGLGDLWWEQAVGFEVYCLHTLFLPIVLLSFLRYVEEERNREQEKKPRIGFTRTGTIFAFTLGLAFTNHMTKGLLGPGFLVYFFWRLLSVKNGQPITRKLARLFQRWIYLAPMFLLPVIIMYSLLMVRAGMHPNLNWGDPETLRNLFYHIRGKDYEAAMFTGGRVFVQQLRYFFNSFPPDVGYLGIVSGLAGLVILVRRNLALAVSTVVILLVTMFYACSYDVNDIGNYFMKASFMIGIWSAVLVGWLHRYKSRTASVIVGSVLVAATALANYTEVNERTNTITEDYAFNILNTLPPNAVVYTDGWDFWEAGALYLQEAENFRKDVVIIDVSLLASDWYVTQLQHTHPAIMDGVRSEAELFKAESVKFRFNKGNYSSQDSAAFNSTLLALSNAIVARNIPSRPFFITYDDAQDYLPPSYVLAPHYLTQQVLTNDSDIVLPSPNYRFAMWRTHIVPQVIWTLKLYAKACLHRAEYESTHGRPELEQQYLNMIPQFDPKFSDDEVPDFPVHIERQVIEDLRFLRKAGKR